MCVCRWLLVLPRSRAAASNGCAGRREEEPRRLDVRLVPDPPPPLLLAVLWCRRSLELRWWLRSLSLWSRWLWRPWPCGDLAVLLRWPPGVVSLEGVTDWRWATYSSLGLENTTGEDVVPG